MLTHGMAASAYDQLLQAYGFEDHGNRFTKITRYISVMENAQNCGYFSPNTVKGDCTAITVNTEGLIGVTPERYEKVLRFLTEYMSMQGRISAFLALKQHKEKAKDFIKVIRKFPTLGVHVQESNRGDGDYYVQIGFILKVLNPQVSGDYLVLEQYNNNWDVNNNTHYNEVAAQFKLHQFKEF